MSQANFRGFGGSRGFPIKSKSCDLKAVRSLFKVGRAVFLFAFLMALLFGSIPGRAQSHGKAMSNNSSRDLSASPPDLFFSEGKRTSVILDGCWSRGYAQASCEAESADASEIGRVFQRDRCAEFKPATATLDFEDKLMNHLRTNARCRV